MSKLSRCNVIKGINTRAFAMVRYFGGILEWNQEGPQAIDRKPEK